MRVLLTTDSYRPNIDGAAVFVERLARKLRQKGIDVQIVAPSPTLRSYDTEENGVQIHFRAAWKPLRDKGMLVAISPAVREVAFQFQPAIVHINLPFRIGLSSLHAAKYLGIPVISTNHVVIEGISWSLCFTRTIGDTVESTVRKYLLWFYKQCDVVVVPTDQARTMLVGENGESLPLDVVSNGVDLDVFEPRLLESDFYEKLRLPRKPMVLYVGRLEIEKSMDIWLRAAADIRKEADVHLLIAGSGTLQGQLEAMTRDLGLADHVSFLGPCSDSQLARLYNAATVFLICSATESQSIATLEAMASGLPIVARNAAALPALVQEGRNGFLCPTADPEAIAKRVLQILGDAGRQRAFSIESRRIASLHSLDRTVDRYIALYSAMQQSARDIRAA